MRILIVLIIGTFIISCKTVDKNVQKTVDTQEKLKVEDPEVIEIKRTLYEYQEAVAKADTEALNTIVGQGFSIINIHQSRRNKGNVIVRPTYKDIFYNELSYGGQEMNLDIENADITIHNISVTAWVPHKVENSETKKSYVLFFMYKAGTYYYIKTITYP
ncbi:hypothetical protein IMCC3317_09890 [Kordia antarctica]|uniref:Uncharacterized protein n=2 Tax=Kordia antarctica TaxID=1218801 RepID=A0A7L4ZG22_9FLAO|nr:hypothetical protein IMCC3317_09890 [Kordia antarctica]